MKLRQIKTAVKIITSTAVSKPLRRFRKAYTERILQFGRSAPSAGFDWTSSAVFADLNML